MATSKVRRVRRRGLLEEEDHLLGVECVAEVFRRALDGVGELHDGGHLLHGEVGDGDEVAAGEAFGGFGVGVVGLDAEGDGGLGRLRFVGRRIHDESLVGIAVRSPKVLGARYQVIGERRS